MENGLRSQEFHDSKCTIINEWATFETLLCLNIQLISLGDILDELLNDDTVVNTGITRVNLDVVVARERRHLDDLLRGRLELLSLDTQLLHSRAVELAKGAHDTSLFAGAVWPEYEQMREIIRVNLYC